MTPHDSGVHLTCSIDSEYILELQSIIVMVFVVVVVARKTKFRLLSSTLSNMAPHFTTMDCMTRQLERRVYVIYRIKENICLNGFSLLFL
jgi:hypothetical protein